MKPRREGEHEEGGQGGQPAEDYGGGGGGYQEAREVRVWF